MLARVLTSSLARRSASVASSPPAVFLSASRQMSTVGVTARDAAEAGCYNTIDFCINEDSSVVEAIQKLCAFNIGCLVTTNSKGTVTGVMSERDYISKMIDKDPSMTKVKDISTPKDQLVTAKPHESVELCMQKMLDNEIRHLPLMDTKCGELLGMVSIKDLVRTTVKEKEETIKVLTNMTLGKEAYSI